MGIFGKKRGVIKENAKIHDDVRKEDKKGAMDNVAPKVDGKLDMVIAFDTTGSMASYFSGVSCGIICLYRGSPDSHLCDSGLCTLRISEGKSKGVQESGLHHKNNKFYCMSPSVSSAFFSFLNDLSSSCSLASSSLLSSIMVLTYSCDVAGVVCLRTF